MRNQTHPIPKQHSSYENVRNLRTVYYGWLAPYNGNAVDKRKPIRPQPGMPAIGTFRVTTPNFEKESLTEPPENGTQRPVYSSLVLDNECLNMTGIELRVEDYYLLRTCGPNSDLYKIINDKHINPPFNIALHTEFCKHHNLPIPNLVSPDLNKAYPLNANSTGLRMGNQLAGSNPFSQARVHQPGRNFGTGFGVQGQQPTFGGNSNNNNNSGGFLNQPKPFQTAPQNAFQPLPQSNAFSPPKTNAFQPLPPNNGFQSPAVNPPANGLIKSGQGQFQTPLDRLSHVFPNQNNPNMANNSNVTLPKPPDNQLANSSVGIPFQKNNQGGTTNAFANIFSHNNGQGASSNNMFSPSLNNSTTSTNNTNMFGNNMSSTNVLSSNVGNNNMFNNNLPNQNSNANNTSVNMPNSTMTNNPNMYSQPTINQNNTTPPSNPIMPSLLPSEQVPPCQTYSNVKTPVDLFLQFFYNDLYQAIQRYPSIREILRDHIKKCFIFHERTQELTSCLPGREDALLSPLGRKHRETLEIKKIMDGFEKELLERQGRNKFPEDFRNYALLVWNELQEFYAERVWETKMELQHQTTEEAVKALQEDLQQKEMFYMNRLNSLFQTDPSPLTNTPLIHLSPNLSNHYRISFHPDAISKNFNQLSCAREEREQLARYVFRLEQMKHRLKETTMADMRERQDHLYDCQRMNSDMGDLDDYLIYRRKKSKDNQVMVIIREEDKKTPKTAISTPSRTATERISTKSYERISNKTLKSSPSVSEFTLNDSPASNKETPVPVRVVFKVTVVWVKRQHQDESFKVFQISMHLPEQISRPDLEKRFVKHIQEAKMEYIRGDAQYKFGQIRKFKESWEVSVKIEQQKLNIPATYTFEATYAGKYGKGTRLTSLIIENKHGKVEWKQEIDISHLDFTKGIFSLANNTIECNSEYLNLPCRITFLSLPSKVAKLEEKYFRVEIYEKLRKHVRSQMDMELQSIDWVKRHYTILAHQFFISSQDTPETDKEKQKTPKEADSNFIPFFQAGEL